MSKAIVTGGEYTFIPSRGGQAQDTLANTSKAKELLGWKARVRVEDWIKAKS